jgi:hypothetical protein
MKKILIVTILISFLSISSVYGDKGYLGKEYIKNSEVVSNKDRTYLNEKESKVSSKTDNVVESKISSKEEITIKKYIEQNIIDRFKMFKGNVKIVDVLLSEKSFTLTGRLVSPTGKPMDLVGKFCEALQNCKKFDFVIPSIIKKENVEEQNKVYFVIIVDVMIKKLAKMK